MKIAVPGFFENTNIIRIETPKSCVVYFQKSIELSLWLLKQHPG